MVEDQLKETVRYVLVAFLAAADKAQHKVQAALQQALVAVFRCFRHLHQEGAHEGCVLEPEGVLEDVPAVQDREGGVPEIIGPEGGFYALEAGAMAHGIAYAFRNEKQVAGAALEKALLGFNHKISSGDVHEARKRQRETTDCRSGGTVQAVNPYAVFFHIRN